MLLNERSPRKELPSITQAAGNADLQSQARDGGLADGAPNDIPAESIFARSQPPRQQSRSRSRSSKRLAGRKSRGLYVVGTDSAIAAQDDLIEDLYNSQIPENDEEQVPINDS